MGQREAEVMCDHRGTMPMGLFKGVALEVPWRNSDHTKVLDITE